MRGIEKVKFEEAEEEEDRSENTIMEVNESKTKFKRRGKKQGKNVE